MKPINWPTSDREWWWMRFKIRPNSRKWTVALVHVITNEHGEFIESFEDDKNAYARSICEDQWQATFLPAESPPTEESWNAS